MCKWGLVLFYKVDPKVVTHDLHFHISGEIILNSKYLLFSIIIKDNTYPGFYKKYYTSVFFLRRKYTRFQNTRFKKNTAKEADCFGSSETDAHTSNVDQN